MSADHPGAEEGGGAQRPLLDNSGKFTGRSAAAGFTGAGSVEGTVYTQTHTHTRTHRALPSTVVSPQLGFFDRQRRQEEEEQPVTNGKATEDEL